MARSDLWEEQHKGKGHPRRTLRFLVWMTGWMGVLFLRCRLQEEECVCWEKQRVEGQVEFKVLGIYPSS